MKKDSSLTVKICDWIIKYFILAAVFLTPIFFLPWTSDALDFNKQAALVILLFIALFAWMLKVLTQGKFVANASKINIAAGALFLAYVLATIFSVYRYGSFWGWPQSTSDSLLTLIAVLLAYFLISNTFSKKDIFVSVATLCFSAILAQIAAVFQLLGFFISFNTIGSIGSLGFFTAIMLPIAITMLILSKKWWKILYVIEIILSALILFLINYPMVWWMVAAGAALIMFFGALKRNIFDGRWMALPMFFLAVSIFFILLNPQIPGLIQKVNEVYLTQPASFKIGLQAIKEKPVLGSGPGTFSYDFSKFKDPSFSQSDFWNVNFTQATSKALTDLSTTGVLGCIALLALIILSIFYGVKYLFKEKNGEDWILLLGISSAIIIESITFFLYNSNVALSFIYFLMLGCLASFVSQSKKEYELKPSSVTTLVITFVFIIAFIFGLGLLFLGGQRYVAEINYYNGLALLQNKNLDGGVNSIEKAASINSSSDLYFRQLSQLYLAQLQTQIQSAGANPTTDQKNKIQALMANSINAAKIATDINPQNAVDWSNRGYVYQSLYGLVNDADKWALSSYDTAIKLDPNNPYLYNQEGSVYDAMGQKDQAADRFTKAQQLNPNLKTNQ